MTEKELMKAIKPYLIDRKTYEACVKQESVI